MLITNRGVIEDKEFTEEFSGEEVSVYEVFRIINGTALFLEDHFRRLQNSLQIKGIEFDMTYNQFKLKIAELVAVNQKNEGNVKFVFSKRGSSDYWAFSFIPYRYPDQNDYRNGVSVDLLNGERENPNAKVVHRAIRDKANQMISGRNLYEVLLVDHEGMVTEGSRSNVFFVKGDVFFTAPESMILMGITRQKVMECLKQLNFRIVEEAVSVPEIGSFDAAFLTGTSPKVLPVSSIGKYTFLPNHKVVLQLMESYNAMIDKYIQGNR